MRLSSWCVILASAALAALHAGAASAVELVKGGYGAAAVADLADAPPASDNAAHSSASGGGGSSVVLDFTPRGGGAFAGDHPGEPRLRFELNIAGGPQDRADPLGGAPDAARPSWLEEPQAAKLGDLSIGGALRWSAWSVGGGVARTALFGGEADLMSATLGYGALTASLSYGHADRADLAPLDVMMLSTDLAASSWLKLESNVAVGADRADDQPVAVGRLGVRLNF